MYHYITLGSVVINMTGVGIVLFLCAFLYIVSRESRWRGLNFGSFLRFVPIYILIVYFTGTYFYYLFDQFIIFPLSFEQILLYITPYQYHFSTIGIVVGLLLGGWKFLKNKEKTSARLSAWLYGVVWGLVPLGVFLLLGDAFIGLPTDGGFYVSAIRSDSVVAIYDKVIPLGFYMSLIGLIGGSILYLFHKTMAPHQAYLGFAILIFMLSILFIFQQYPRRFVFPIGEYSIDSKQFFLWFVSVLFLIGRLRARRRYKRLQIR